MSDHLLVEANKRVVGVAVRVPGGFRFFTSDPDYRGLESHVFARAKLIERLAADVAGAIRRSASPTAVH